MLFKIQEDKLITISISQDITFDTLFAVSRYVVTYKTKFPTIRVFHFSNLSLATTIPSEINYNYLGSEDISYEKNLLILSRVYEQTIYNFSESLESAGSISTGEYRFGEAVYQFMVFPTRKIIYSSTNFIDEGQIPF